MSFAAFLLTLATASSASPPSAWQKPRHVVFGLGQAWYVHEVHGDRFERVSIPETHRVSEVAVDPRGELLVFTAQGPGATSDFLYAWNWRRGGPPKSIGNDRGRHGNPAITTDGWVYFSHHPDSDGPPGQHQKKVSNQLYRVRIDGSGFEAMTSAAGCHFSPSATSSHQVLFIHTPCSSSRSIESIKAGSAYSRIAEGSYFEEIALSPDGKRLLFSVAGQVQALIAELRIQKTASAPKVLGSVPRATGAVRVRYGAGPEDVLYQDDNRVMHLKDGASRVLFDMSKGS